MQDGTQKQIAEANLQLRTELIAIEKARSEIANKLKESGYTPGTESYTQEYQKYDTQLYQQEQTAKQANANTIVKIEKESADKIADIWTSVTNNFVSDQQIEIKAVMDKYNAMIAEARKAGDKITEEMLNSEKDNEIDRILQYYALQRIDFEEEVANRRGEINEKYYADQILAEKKRLERERKFAQQRIAELSKVDKEANRKQIEGLLVLLDENQKATEQLKVQWLSGILEGVSSFGDGLGNSLSNLLQLGTASKTLFENLEKGGSKLGAVSGIVGMLSVAINQMQKFEAEQQESIANFFEIQNREIERQIDLINDLYGSDRTKAEEEAKASIKEEIGYYEQLAASTKAVLQSKYSVDPFGIIHAWTTTGRKTFEDVQEMIDWLESADTESKLASGDYRIKNFDEINNIVNGYLAAKEKLEGLTEQEATIRVGFEVESVADDLAKGIEEGLKLSESGLGDWTESFGELLKKSLMNQLKEALSKQMLVDFMKDFEAAMTDGLLSETEAGSLEKLYMSSIQEAQKKWDALSPILDKYLTSDTSSASSLTGAISGITEETAGIIAGQFYAMRENLLSVFKTGVEQLDIANRSMTYLSGIEKNTRDISLLNQTNSKLDEMNRYLKSLL